MAVAHEAPWTDQKEMRDMYVSATTLRSSCGLSSFWCWQVQSPIQQHSLFWYYDIFEMIFPWIHALKWGCECLSSRFFFDQSRQDYLCSSPACFNEAKPCEVNLTTSPVWVGLEGNTGRVESNPQKSLSLWATVSFTPRDPWKSTGRSEFGTLMFCLVHAIPTAWFEEQVADNLVCSCLALLIYPALYRT